MDWPGHGGLEQVGLPPALQAFSLMFSNGGMRGYYDNGANATGPRRPGPDRSGLGRPDRPARWAWR